MASVVSTQLSGRRPIRIHHLAAYMRALDSQERGKLLNAWLRDNVDPETIHDLLNGQTDLHPEVRDWAPELNKNQAAMLNYWAQELPNDKELEQVFAHLTQSVGFRFRGMAEKFTGQLNLRELTERGPVFVWLDGLEGKGCTFVSKPFLRLTGTKLKDNLGTGWAQRIHPKERKYVQQRYRQAVLHRSPVVTIYRLKRRDGKYRWISSQGIPRYDERGKFVGYIGCGMDITDALPSQKQCKLPACLGRA